MEEKHYFGTDGIRGRFGEGFFNEAFIEKFGNVLKQWWQSQGKQGTILIGRDTRSSGLIIEKALMRGLCDDAFEIISEGVLPTPALSYLIKERKAIGGIMITASHNPAEDNGLKVLGAEGKKLRVEDEDAIESILRSIEIEDTGDTLSTVRQSSPKKREDVDMYVGFAKNILPKNILKGWKVVLDTANGVAVNTAPDVFHYLGCELIGIGNEPNGFNINKEVGSEHPNKLQQMVKALKADIGFAYDGDGDRVVVCDNEGNIMTGDQLLGILALQALKKGKLKQNAIVATIQSNMGLDWSLQKKGCKVVRVDVGDRNVLYKMEALGCNLGGESSGHIIYRDYLNSGDGLLASLKLLESLLEVKKSLKELCQNIQLFPQRTKNIRIKQKKVFEELIHIQQSISSLEKKFGKEGRLLVRYSGTEPMIRLLAEHRDAVQAQKGIKSLEAAVEKDLEVIRNV